jgi:uncharacterized LabA/DUF88 family protein
MDDCKLALFIDFENIARGVRQRHLEERVDLQAILGELETKGRILLKRAYADWGYYKDYRSDLLQNGIEPVQVFAASRDREGWKNGADIRIAIEAVEAVFRFPEITDFVLVSGDSDFLSLVTRLREHGKTVWGVGLKASSSQYLVKSCDHYLFYEDVADWLPEEHTDVQNGHRRDSRTLLLSTVRRMTDRQGLPGMPPPGTPLKALAVKAAMRRLDPTWEEQFEGYTSFIEFLLAHQDVILCGRPGEAPEFYLAERGTVAEASLQRMLGVGNGNGNGHGGNGHHDAAHRDENGARHANGGYATPEQRYLAALRVRRIRHVPMRERYAIVQALFRIFEDARAAGEELSLKEAKDRLHEWFEQNEPSVPWDNVNNVVYHLFWTYCFEFTEAADDVPLWDRPTRWFGGMQSFEEIIRRCDHGLVRMIADHVGTVDPQIAAQVLGDGSEEHLPFFEEVCAQVNGRFGSPVDGGRSTVDGRRGA